MTIIEAIILGIIQGLTEFLPISSSGHLVLSQVILGIQIPGNDFEVLLHIGTLCSILFVFNNDIKNILFTLSSQKTQKFILMILVGTIPALCVATTPPIVLALKVRCRPSPASTLPGCPP